MDGGNGRGQVIGKGGWSRPAVVPNPIHDGDGPPNGEAFGPECRGLLVMTASSKVRPEVGISTRTPSSTRRRSYSGMYARVSLNFFPYFTSGKRA